MTEYTKPSSKEEIEEIPLKKRTKTISELYLLNRQGMLSCTDEYQYYRRLMESISIGVCMLPGDHPLIEEANTALSSEANYPEKRNMAWLDSRGVYSCSSGVGDTGKVTVRPEELEVGEISLRNQQCNQIIRNLTLLDRKIFNMLLETSLLRRLTVTEEVEGAIMKQFKSELDGKDKV